MATATVLNEPPVRRAGSRQLIRLSVLAGMGVAAIWLLGFGWFLWLSSRESQEIQSVDAIVVLTGGPDRVEVALRLLASGTGDRLLVSGAGEKTDLAALAHRVGVDPAPLEQMITLGHTAHSTRGNAVETASWARDQGIGSLLVVTAWFHMPRAMTELRRAMPTIQVRPYPVGRLSPAEFTRAGMVRRVVGEYHKYLATMIGVTESPFAMAAWRMEARG
jgi:uncharacterized SAM-binding protein YcdF (DUF218 family)